MPSTISGDANVSATEFGYLDGVTSALQTQINSKVTTPGAWTTYTPTVTAGTGSFTTVSGSGLYIQVGKIVHVRLVINITTNGTAATEVIATLPVAGTGNSVGLGRENASTGKMLQAFQYAASNISIRNFDGTYPGGTGYALYVSMTYEAA